MALPALTIDLVKNATGVDLEAWAKDVTALENKAKSAADALKGGLYDAGLVVYGVKLHHALLQEQKHVGSTAPWSATWKRLTGSDKPTPRATTMALAIEAYVVESGHLTETQARACPVDSLETAVGIYKDAGQQLTHEAVLKAANLLKGYTAPISDKERKGIIRELKALRRSLKPAEPMDEEEALDLVKQVLTANPRFATLVATELMAHLRYEKTPEILHGVWSQLQLGDDIFPGELVETWLSSLPGAKAPAAPQNAPAPTPAAPAAPAPTRSEAPEPAAEPAAASTPDFRGWAQAAYADTPAVHGPFTTKVEKFHAEHGRLPADRPEFERWIKAAAAARKAATAAPVIA